MDTNKLQPKRTINVLSAVLVTTHSRAFSAIRNNRTELFSDFYIVVIFNDIDFISAAQDRESDGKVNETADQLAIQRNQRSLQVTWAPLPCAAALNRKIR